MSTAKILAFAGSLRRDSYNKKLARYAAARAEAAGATVTVIDLRDYPLPLFDEDLEREQGTPAHAKELKRIFLEHDGLILACPEYNSSITAVLKNTIDWLSRKEGDEAPLACFAEKSALLLAASPGQLGGLRGLIATRAILGYINVLVLPEQLAVSKAHEAFDGTGHLVDAKQAARVDGMVKKLVDTVSKLHR